MNKIIIEIICFNTCRNEYLNFTINYSNIHFDEILKYIHRIWYRLASFFFTAKLPSTTFFFVGDIMVLPIPTCVRR